MADAAAADKNPRKSANEVLEALRTKIVYGGLAPDTRINIDAIARELEVSATPVRDALQRLEPENLVVYAPGRGYATAPLLDMAGLRALYDFRLLVEPWAARTVAGDALSNPAPSLFVEVDRLAELASREPVATLELVRHDQRFHDLVVAATGNTFATDAYRHTNCHMHVYRLYGDRVSPNATLAEHREIADAMAAKDGARASEAMITHITNSFRRYVASTTPH
ncbi:GntR family transcriptional regulator [Prauserella cavernicola]|uniref:GntR family transcriptional regulator n=1 Tax=Prauserella cavernicola TaxID=2800127 RepID=A0A934V3K3_9PSEU|nr:GntR family transcriptional regulator [Prauserella cavernicola]MBK1787361.1 GntR family transcriptional regulator [Prauserella cavernicola]